MAIELYYENAKSLKENIERAAVTNCIIEECALRDDNRKADFYICESASAENSTAEHPCLRKGQPITTLTPDSILKQYYSVPDPIIIKTKAQGNGPIIFTHGKRLPFGRNCPILTEFSPRGWKKTIQAQRNTKYLDTMKKLRCTLTNLNEGPIDRNNVPKFSRLAESINFWTGPSLLRDDHTGSLESLNLSLSSDNLAAEWHVLIESV
ncbi:MAG: hypothetical protein JRN20_21890 [Nitrososphaerota archaeon]|nr:hypothetical protein [Nitrososphaerota archaeon]